MPPIFGRSQSNDTTVSIRLINEITRRLATADEVVIASDNPDAFATFAKLTNRTIIDIGCEPVEAGRRVMASIRAGVVVAYVYYHFENTCIDTAKQVFDQVEMLANKAGIRLQQQT